MRKSHIRLPATLTRLNSDTLAIIHASRHEWDVVHDEGLSEAEKQRALSQAHVDLDVPEEEPSDAERAAQIARRLKA